MKLFQRLLVAPAALGLLSPLVANATEVNLNDISNYSEVESIDLANSFENNGLTKNLLLAGGEGLVDSNTHDGGFSETTTASFSADFAIGALDGKGISTGVTDGDEDLQAAYGFQIDLNTSFTGEDSLDISIDAGNGPVNGSGSSTSPLAEFDLNSGSDALTVDGVSYTFPLGGLTAIVGDNTDGSALFTTACAYGGPSNTLDDCGNVNAGITNGGLAVGASYDFGNGFTTAVGYAGAETGIMTKETTDAYGANVAYTADSYGVSLTYGLIETGTNGINENTYTALNGYYSFDSGLNISAGYEIGDIGGAAATADESINYFVGVNGEVGPGELGAALGTSGGQLENQTEELMYEAYYSYPVNDGMTITPLVYIKEKATAGTPDETGVMVKTSFSF
jgi:hypothetical protein